jgi:hypothetical protein
MAAQLRKIACANFQKDDFDKLTEIIEAGVLPSLTELALILYWLDMVTLGALKDNPRLKTLIIDIILAGPDMSTPVVIEVVVALFQAVQRGSFPKMKIFNMEALTSDIVQSFIDMLKSGGVGGADTLRNVLVGPSSSEEALQELRALLPAATVRRGRE